jgi:hypothetical protein
MEQDAKERARKGVAVMTAWWDGGCTSGSTEFASDVVSAQLMSPQERVSWEVLFARSMGLCGGLMAVSGKLLLEFARVTCQTPEQVLEQLARAIEAA